MWTKVSETGTTADGLANLRPVFKQNGRVTNGNSSTLNDGASAILVAEYRLQWIMVGR